MSTLTGKDLNLVKPALTDDHKVTIGTDLPANFQKIDDEFSAHLAETVSQSDGVHGLSYEVGTWTPLLGSEAADTGQSYTTQTGTYVKIGSLVILHFDVRLSAKGTLGGGYLSIKGLPFYPKDTYGTGSVGIIQNLATALTFVTLSFNSSKYIGIFGTANAATTPTGSLEPITYLSDTTWLHGSFTYRT